MKRVKPGQRRKEWNWDADAVRCENCKHFRNTYIVLVNSLPRAVVQHCDIGGFHTTPKSACDMWEEKPSKTRRVSPK